MGSIFFTADYHFNHERIIAYCGRPFKSIDGMNNSIIHRHNELVGPKDTIYIIGDFALYALPIEIKAFLNRMYGEKILVLGNHDRLSKKKFRECGFNGVYNIYEVNGFVLSHWPSFDHDSIVLCGHVHQHWKIRRNNINVGVDVWDFYPVPYDTVEKLRSELYVESIREEN